MNNAEELARRHAQKCLDNAGVAKGVCEGFVAIVHAILYAGKKNASDYDEACRLAKKSVSDSDRALGLCHGIAAITYAILAVAE